MPRKDSENNVELTVAFLKSLRAPEPEPSGQRRELVYHDTKQPGLDVRIVSGQSHPTFTFRYYNKRGRRRRVSLGTTAQVTLAKARDLAQAAATSVRSGSDPAQDRIDRRQAGMSVAMLWEEYLQRHARRHKRPRSVAEDEALWRLCEPHLGTMSAVDVGPRDLAKIKGSLADRPIRWNRVRSLLSGMFAWAAHPERGLLPSGHPNPALGVEKNEERSRERFLQPDELAAVGRALVDLESAGRITPTAANAIRLLILTGARKSEVTGLRWDQVRAEGIVFAHGEHKGKGGKVVALTPAAAAVLTAQQGAHATLVFPGESGKCPVSLHNPWKKVVETSGIAPARLHDLRHSYASAAVALGVNLTAVRALLGHRDIATSAKYAHLGDKTKAAAAATVSEHLARAMAGDAADVVDVAQAGATDAKAEGDGA